MPVSIAARLARLEQAEERRTLERRAAVVVSVYGCERELAWDIVVRSDAACRKCAAIGGDERAQAICIARELGHEDAEATAEEYLASLERIARRRSGGLGNEEILRLMCAERWGEEAGGG